MKVCFAVPVRDKAKFLPRTLHYALGQDFPNLEIIFSDQGSVDDSLKILKEWQSRYDGPHTFRVLECPHTETRGMAALNLHLNWIHEQTDADIFISCAADDVSYPQRTRKVVEAFEKFNPSMVINAQFFAEEDGKYGGETGYPTEDGWVKIDELFPRMIGGSTIQSWSREFYEAIGGLGGIGSPDMVMPILAIKLKGCYYLQERLHVYCKVSDPSNTGLEGVLRAAKSEEEIMQIEELCHMQVMVGLHTAVLKLHSIGKLDQEANAALIPAILDRASGWQNVRQRMALRRLQPMVFKA